MPSGDEYRALAAEMSARARNATEADVREELEALAWSYLRLAEQADRNAKAGIVYQPPQPDQPDNPPLENGRQDPDNKPNRSREPG